MKFLYFDLCLLSFYWAPLRVVWLHLLYSPHQAFLHIDNIPPSFFFSKLNNPSALSLSSCVRCSSLLVISVAFCCTRSSVSMSLLYWRSRTGLSTPEGSNSRWGEGKDHFPWPSGNVFLNIASVLLAAFAARAHCCLTGTLSTGTPSVLQNCFQAIGLQRILVHVAVCSQVQDLVFPSAEFLSLLRSLWMATQSSGILTTPPSFLSSADFGGALWSIISVTNDDVKQFRSTSLSTGAEKVQDSFFAELAALLHFFPW